MSGVTRILSAIENGDAAASEQLLPIVYQELRTLAAAKLTGETPGQTLQPTMLVHEAYLRLVDVENQQQWDSRGHFFAAAAEAMRRILIENARRKRSQKRGGGGVRVDLNDVEISVDDRDIDLLALDEALDRLGQRWPEKAKLVKLRYFAGMTIAEASQLMGVSHATAERHWKFARTWLYSQLNGE